MPDAITDATKTPAIAIADYDAVVADLSLLCEGFDPSTLNLPESCEWSPADIDIANWHSQQYPVGTGDDEMLQIARIARGRYQQPLALLEAYRLLLFKLVLTVKTREAKMSSSYKQLEPGALPVPDAQRRVADANLTSGGLVLGPTASTVGKDIGSEETMALEDDKVVGTGKVVGEVPQGGTAGAATYKTDQGTGAVIDSDKVLVGKVPKVPSDSGPCKDEADDAGRTEFPTATERRDAPPTSGDTAAETISSNFPEDPASGGGAKGNERESGGATSEAKTSEEPSPTTSSGETMHTAESAARESNEEFIKQYLKPTEDKVDGLIAALAPMQMFAQCLAKCFQPSATPCK